MDDPPAPKPVSPFAPLSNRTFAMLWGAALIANIATWFRDVANGWTMTELSASPLMVSLVQAAAMAPIFLLSLPAGALADLVSRRRMLIAIQALLILTSASLAIGAQTGTLTPELLLALTALGGVGAALMGPPWQALVPDLVDRSLLRPAIALNSLGVNLARAIGPALGGFLIAAAGVAAAYWIDAASYLLVILALALWRHAPTATGLPRERFAAAMASGIGYVARNADVRRVIVRAVAFFVFASAYWALLPLVARGELGGDASVYGVLLAGVGAGAVLGAFALPSITRALTPGRLVLAGTFATSAACAALAIASDVLVAFGALALAGAAWISVLTTLSVALQSALPSWVRARGLAIYLTAFYGAMTAGSIGWGAAASVIGVGPTLAAAAVAGLAVGALASRIPLPAGAQDLTPSMHWPEPASAGEIGGERGPVMIQIVYRVAPADRDAFLIDLAALGLTRLRDGGSSWQVFEDAEDPERFTEVFFASSWIDHLRQHARFTKADALLQDRVYAHHRGEAPPAVSHHLAARPGDLPAAALAPHGRAIA